MKTKFFAIPMVAMGLMAGGAQAASGTASVNMLLNITSNTGTCTVTPSAVSFNLPNGTATQGMQDWMKAAGFTQASQATNGVFIAGTTYDQTVSIACAQPNTNITSIQVAPGSGFAGSAGQDTGIGLMVDSSGNKLAGGSANTSAELVSITSVSGTANQSYSFAQSGTGMARPYATPFMTSTTLDAATNMSMASFVWRPTMWSLNNNALGNPVGGAFKTPWIVTVNY